SLRCSSAVFSRLFLFNAPSSSDISTLSLHDALPIYRLDINAYGTATPNLRISIAGVSLVANISVARTTPGVFSYTFNNVPAGIRSEEHTSELQSRENLVCRLLLEKKNNDTITITDHR